MNIKINSQETTNTLKLSISIKDRAMLSVLHVNDPNYFNSNEALYDVFEWFVCNSDYDWISPGEIGALTDAPILGRVVYFEDDPSDKAIEKLYWGYEPYQIRSPLEDLADCGEVKFTNNW